MFRVLGLSSVSVLGLGFLGMLELPQFILFVVFWGLGFSALRA